MNRVYIKTYGCQMNERDSETVAALLRMRGYSIVEDEADADIVLLNTCSVREQSEQKAIGKTGYLVHRRRTRQPDLLVGIIGCMAQNRGAGLLDRLPDLDLLVGTQKFHRVAEHIDALLATRRGLGPKPATLVDVEEEDGSQNEMRHRDPDRARPSEFISIMQGCNMRCAYCIVPRTRGAERSRPIADIVEEARGLVGRGTREVVLLGQIVNSYGRREIPFRDGLSPFVQLLEALHGIEGLERIRFTSPHPRGFKDDLVAAYARLPKLMPFLHLPLQSGSAGILRAMNRPYSPERFMRIVDSLRAARPDMCLSTDVIVGFPGETDADFAATRDIFERAAFDMAFVFKYSVRPGTPAEPLGDPVPQAVKEARNLELLRILEGASLRRNQSMVGTIQPVLFDGMAKRGADLYSGNTPNSRKVLVHSPVSLIGEIRPVRILKATTTTLHGELE